MLDRIRQSTGVRAASLARVTPISGSELVNQITQIEGYVFKPGEFALPTSSQVSYGYFETMGTPILAGRDFSPHDVSGGKAQNSLHVLISESLARRYFASVNPLGRHLTFHAHTAEIIGIVKDAKYANLRDPAPPTMYTNWMQYPQGGDPTVEVYAADDAHAVAALRDAVHTLDQAVAITGLTTFDRQVQQSLVSERLMAALSALFGGLALLIASIGLYGVLAYAVAQRTKEIGIRMALGAQRSRVISMMLREMLAMVVAGVVIGSTAALALGRFVAAMLYGVKPRDPWTLSLAIALLVGSALVATYLPARRASRVDPMIALRYE